VRGHIFYLQRPFHFLSWDGGRSDNYVNFEYRISRKVLDMYQIEVHRLSAELLTVYWAQNAAK